MHIVNVYENLMKTPEDVDRYAETFSITKDKIDTNEILINTMSFLILAFV